MTRINDVSVYAQAARVQLAAINRSWDGQSQPAAVHAFESAVVTLATINDSTAANTWVASTVATVSGLLV